MRLEGAPVANDLASLQRLRWLTYKDQVTTFVLFVKEVLSPISFDGAAWLGVKLRNLLDIFTYFGCFCGRRRSWRPIRAGLDGCAARSFQDSGKSSGRGKKG